MKRAGSDFDIVDAMRLFSEAWAEYLTTDPARLGALAAAWASTPPDQAAIDAIHAAAGAYARQKLAQRAGGTYLYGKGRIKAMERDVRIAEAMAVCPKLSMAEVARRAGISRSHLYRLREQSTHHK